MCRKFNAFFTSYEFAKTDPLLWRIFPKYVYNNRFLEKEREETEKSEGIEYLLLTKLINIMLKLVNKSTVIVYTL